MSGFLDSVRSTSQFVHSSRSDYDDDGAKAGKGILASKIDDIENFFSAAGTVSVKDAPAYMDAIQNMNGVGLDDREFLVCIYLIRTYYRTEVLNQ
jgi:linoleate 10R-lipoxygenase